MTALLAIGKVLWALRAYIAGAVVVGLLAALLITYGNNRYHAGEAAQLLVDGAKLSVVQGDLDQCNANVKVKDDAIAGQNASIAQTAADSAKALAVASAGVTAAQKETALGRAKIASLMKPLTGIDTCARVLEANDRLTETLK